MPSEFIFTEDLNRYIDYYSKSKADNEEGECLMCNFIHQNDFYKEINEICNYASYLPMNVISMGYVYHLLKKIRNNDLTILLKACSPPTLIIHVWLKACVPAESPKINGIHDMFVTIIKLLFRGDSSIVFGNPKFTDGIYTELNSYNNSVICKGCSLQSNYQQGVARRRQTKSWEKKRTKLAILKLLLTCFFAKKRLI